MFSILQDILIITESGKAVASKISNKNIEEQLFAMLLSALNSFAQELTHGQLKCIQFSKMRFDFIKRKNFIFMASSSVKIKHDKALKILKIVSDIFFKRFTKKMLDKWDGSLNIFNELDDEIQKSTEDLFKELVFKENKPKVEI